MKLITPAGLGSIAHIRVRDSRGNVWDVTSIETQPRRTRYSDYQGPDIMGTQLSVTTPADHGSEVLVIPPISDWKEGVVYDGVLKHPGGDIRWA